MRGRWGGREGVLKIVMMTTMMAERAFAMFGCAYEVVVFCFVLFR